MLFGQQGYGGQLRVKMPLKEGHKKDRRTFFFFCCIYNVPKNFSYITLHAIDLYVSMRVFFHPHFIDSSFLGEAKKGENICPRVSESMARIYSMKCPCLSLSDLELQIQNSLFWWPPLYPVCGRILTLGS
jgi:hypothetical protein